MNPGFLDYLECFSRYWRVPVCSNLIDFRPNHAEIALFARRLCSLLCFDHHESSESLANRCLAVTLESLAFEELRFGLASLGDATRCTCCRGTS